jgi:hypothetical protein
MAVIVVGGGMRQEAVELALFFVISFCAGTLLMFRTLWVVRASFGWGLDRSNSMPFRDEAIRLFSRDPREFGERYGFRFVIFRVMGAVWYGVSLVCLVNLLLS